MKPLHKVCLLLLILSFSCQNDEKKAEKSNQISKNQAIDNKSVEAKKVVILHEAYRMRQEPGLDSPIIAELDIEEELDYLGESVASETSIRLGGMDTQGNWLKVKREEGEEGWIYGPGTVNKKDYIQSTGNNSFVKHWNKLSQEQAALLIKMKTPKDYVVSGSLTYVKSLKNSIYKDGEAQLVFKHKTTTNRYQVQGQYTLGKATGSWFLSNFENEKIELLFEDAMLTDIKKSGSLLGTNKHFNIENADWGFLFEQLR